MQPDGHGMPPVLHPQVIIQRLDQLVHAGFGGAVAEPTAAGVVADGADARGHDGEDGGVAEALFGGELGGFPREEGHEVFGQDHGGQQVELEGCQRGVVGDFFRRPFGDQHPRREDGEAEVRAFVALAVVVPRRAVRRQGADGGFALHVAVLHVEARVLVAGDAVEQAGFRAGEVGARGGYDGEGGGVEEVLDEGEADSAGGGGYECPCHGGGGDGGGEGRGGLSLVRASSLSAREVDN